MNATTLWMLWQAEGHNVPLTVCAVFAKWLERNDPIGIAPHGGVSVVPRADDTAGMRLLAVVVDGRVTPTPEAPVLLKRWWLRAHDAAAAAPYNHVVLATLADPEARAWAHTP